MRNVIVLITVTFCILFSCSEERVIQPPPISLDFNVFCDTCGNDLPITFADSVMGSHPPLNPSTATMFVTYSPSKQYIAGDFFSGSSPFNVFIYDIVHDKPVAMFPNRQI